MSEPESTNTMFHDAFVKNGDGDYSLKTLQSPVVVGQATSITAKGSANAPAANAAIATTAALPIGVWDVEVSAFVGGATAPADVMNMQLKQDVNTLGTILVPIAGTTGANGSGHLHQIVKVTNSAPLVVQAIGASTASSVYYASISASRIA